MRVELTEPQAAALLAAVAYCTAGDPEDWGQDDGPDGARIQRNLERASDRLTAAMRRNPDPAPTEVDGVDAEGWRTIAGLLLVEMADAFDLSGPWHHLVDDPAQARALRRLVDERGA